MVVALKFMLNLSVAVWLGMLIFFTLFAAPSIFKVLPRELAGDVVGAIFPKYWAIGCVCGVISLSSLLALSFIEKGFPAVRLILLSLMTALTFYSALVIAPRAVELKKEMKAADESGREALRKEFGRAHMRSFAANIVVMASGVAFVFFAALDKRL